MYMQWFAIFNQQMCFLSPRGEGILHTQVRYKLYAIETLEVLLKCVSKPSFNKLTLTVLTFYQNNYNVISTVKHYKAIGV